MNSDILAYVPIFFSGITLLVLVAEKVWGGGNALAAKFHKLDKETAEAIAQVRSALELKVGEYERVSTVGFEAIRANIHALQMAALEFRAKMSEDLHLYIRKDDYNAGISDIKRDVQAGFQRVDERLGQLQDIVMYSNGDGPRPQHQKARS